MYEWYQFDTATSCRDRRIEEDAIHTERAPNDAQNIRCRLHKNASNRVCAGGIVGWPTASDHVWLVPDRLQFLRVQEHPVAVDLAVDHVDGGHHVRLLSQ